MKIVKVGNKKIGEDEPCLISLEPGGTYTDIEGAKQMIKATAMAGADAVKFQTFLPSDADRIMGKKDIMINFKTYTGKKQERVYDAFKRRELTKDAWKELVRYAKELNILFFSTAIFPETVDFLVELNIDAIKVAKGDINNVLLIEKIAKSNLPVILDAREKLADVDRAVKICEENNNQQIIILHCPSGYPAENAGVHLRAIERIRKKYEYPVGFADHSPGDLMNFPAIALGASILEKTITIDKTIEHVEHFMSLELDELKAFIQNIRAIEEAMGDPNILTTSRVEESVRRSIVAKRDIKKGEKLTRNSLDFMRPGDAGIACSEGFEVLDKTVLKNISKGSFLQWNMLE